MKVLPFRTVADADNAAEIVREHLANDGIVAYPTETVYGFGCALRPTPLAVLAAIKGREADRPFLVLADEPLRLPGLQWNAAAYALASRFWPGPLTIALAADADMYEPPVLSSSRTVAVRQTPLAPLRSLLASLGAPITSTSANAPGSPPGRSADDVLATLQAVGALDVLVLDGGAMAASIPSTVVDCAGMMPRLVREGAVSLATLRAALSPGGFTIDA